MLRWSFCLLFFVVPLFAGSLSGTVSDRNGSPLGSVNIVAYDSTTICAAGFDLSTSSGAYTIADLPDGTYYILYAGEQVLTRFAGNQNERDLADAQQVTVNGATTLNITGQLAGSLAGNVAVSGGQLSRTALQLVDPVTLVPVISLGGSGGSPLGDDGSYTLTGIEPGCYLLGLSYDLADSGDVNPVYFYPNATDPANAARLQISAGEARNDLDVTFDLNRLGTLEVQLNGTLAGTQPFVTVVDRNSRSFTQAGSESGPTRLLLPPGEYRVGASFETTYRDEVAATSVQVSAGATTNTTLTPREGNRIRGNVTLPAGVFSTSAELEVLDADSGVSVATQALSAAPGVPVPYEISGLPDGRFLVRVLPTGSFSGLPLPGFARAYYGDVGFAANADSVTLTGGQSADGIDINPGSGGSVAGELYDDGGLIAGTLVAVVAIESTSGERFNGTFSSVIGNYNVSGLPAGTYRIAVNPGLAQADSFEDISSQIFSTSLAGCTNLGTGYYPTATSENGAFVVEVAAGGNVTGLHIQVRGGGIISGTIRDSACDCPVQNNLVAAYQDETLLAVGLAQGGRFQIGGLATGNYTLRTASFAPQLDFDADLSQISGLSFARYLELFGESYVGSVSVSEGNISSISDWCISRAATGGGDGGSGSGDSKLLYAWISNNDLFESVLVVNNPGTEAATVALTATRANGESALVQRTVPARGFLRESAADLFPTLGSGYTVLLESAGPDLRGRWVTNNLQSTGGSGQSPSQAVAVDLNNLTSNETIGNEILFGFLPSSDGFISAPVVVNVGAGNTDITLRFYDQNGALIGNTVITDVAPYVPIARVASDLLDIPADAYMIASATNGNLTGVNFVFNEARESAMGNVSRVNRSDSGAANLLYPWVSNNVGLFESLLVAANYSDRAVAVSLTARREGGDSQTVQRTIAAGGFLREEAGSLFPELGSGAGYSVELSADTSLIQGLWVTFNTALGKSPSQGVAVDLNAAGTRKGASLLYGFLPNTNGFIAAPVFVNTGTTPVDINLYFYDQNGAAVMPGATLNDVTAKEPIARTLSDLVGNAAGDLMVIAQAADGRDLTGVVFVFNGAREPAIGNASTVNFNP